jgi:uncharacterized membrane protein
VQIETPRPIVAASAAQATLVSGQNEVMDLAHQSTVVSLNIDQAANAVAQTTIDFNQRQLMELSIRGTEVRQNMDRAAATQQAFGELTQAAANATATVQSQAATADYSVYMLSVANAAQAQANLDAQVAQTAEAAAALTAYPMTATPLAETQAALLMQQYDREHQAFVDQIVAPLIPIVDMIAVVLILVGIVLAYIRYRPQRRRLPAGTVVINPVPMFMNDSVASAKDPWLRWKIPSGVSPMELPGLAGQTIHVEMIDATEPPVAHWIAEAEYQLDTEGWRPQ